jgi:uncharacterized membrane protein YphA (DoxX/SURF4 family)
LIHAVLGPNAVGRRAGSRQERNAQLRSTRKSALVEFFGGVLLAIGLLTRLAAVMLVVEFAVIVFAVQFAIGFFAFKGGFELELLLDLLCLAIFFKGSGRLSADHAIAKEAIGTPSPINLIARWLRTVGKRPALFSRCMLAGAAARKALRRSSRGCDRAGSVPDCACRNHLAEHAFMP